jgi:DNA polymerase III delta subunit
LKCEAINLGKHLESSGNIFFIFGSEIILKNHVRSRILNNLQKKGFEEKIILNDENFKDIPATIAANAGGSLFGSNIIIEIKHGSGKIPESITSIFNDEINNHKNVSIIINTHLEKVSLLSKWAKKMDEFSLIVECKKLKSFEEQIWLKKNLDFMPSDYRTPIAKLLADMNSGNLVAQQNEIELLRLLYKNNSESKKDLNALRNHMVGSSEFSPFELEDAIIQRKASKAIKIIHTLKKADNTSGPLLVWIVSKITSLTYLASKDSNPQVFLKNNGIWQSKMNDYLSFLKKQTVNDLDLIQKDVYELELSLKGLRKKDFWLGLESLICKLASN